MAADRVMEEPLLNVRELVVEYRRGRGLAPLKAVDRASFKIAPGETLGLVGESGSGKTTIGRAILGLAPIQGGSVEFAGTDITRANNRQRRALSADLQVIFQDPYSSLNPTRTVGQTLGETLRAQGVARETIQPRVVEMLARVGLPADAAHRYPSRFSGGQRQRIAIARALMANPRLVVCDEPASALDLSVQAQVLNLLRELQHAFNLSYLFIAHDLSVVRYLSRRVIVLYKGRIVEEGDADSIYENPLHPYTQALLASAPVPNPDLQRTRRLARQKREAGNAGAKGATACPFAPRCPHAIELCRTDEPPLEQVDGGTLVACHRWHDIQAKGVAVTETGPVQVVPQ